MISLKEKENLIQQAKLAIEGSYAKYSNFNVGASVLNSCGKIFSGANVENSSYSLTICAERNAIFKSVNSGCREILAVAVYHNGKEFPYPCGACLQVIQEFSRDCEIFVLNDNQIIETTLKELYPIGFKLNQNN